MSRESLSYFYFVVQVDCDDHEDEAFVLNQFELAKIGSSLVIINGFSSKDKAYKYCKQWNNRGN